MGFMATAPAAAAPPDGPAACYRRRRAKSTPLWRLVHRHWPEYEAAYEERFEPRRGRLRGEVRRTVQGYLRCGVLDHGFARVRCGDCGHDLLVAFSCKGRGLCPSCSKQRQLVFGDFVTGQVLEAVPHRHIVFTIPRRLRLAFRYDRRRLARLARSAYRVVEETLREAAGDRRLRPGAIAAVQTFGGLLDFHPHIHMLLTDGGFDAGGRFVRAALPPAEVVEGLFRHRVFRLLLDEEAIGEEVVEGMLAWRRSGFSVHVGRPIAPDDRRALVALTEYLVRGPIALGKLTVAETESGPRVTLRSSRYHVRHRSDRRDFEPLDFLATLFDHIPGTHEKTVIYYGYYSNRSRGLRKKAAVGEGGASAPGPLTLDDEEDVAAAGPARRRWAALIRKVYETDPLVCPRCRGEMKIIAFITDEEVVFRILRHLDLFEPDPPARGPPVREVEAAIDEVAAVGGLFDGLEPDDDGADESARREVEALDALVEAGEDGRGDASDAEEPPPDDDGLAEEA
jgi:hypothetical protein